MSDQVLPDKASEWLMLLLERPGDPEIEAAFAAWRAADPANARDWVEISRTYELIGDVSPAPHRTVRQATPASAYSRTRKAAAGIVLALAACLALLVAPEIAIKVTADAVTGTGELRRVALADGSTVHLAPNSAIAVDLAERRRSVRLLRGAAFFDVAHDDARPFVVDAETIDTTVVGTAFEVRRRGDNVSVAVREGRVRVAPRTSAQGGSRILTAGQWVRMDADGRLTAGQVPVAQISAWMQGRLFATDMSVSDAVDELRPYISGFVLVTDERLGEQPLTGVYNLTDPLGALEALAASHGAKVTRIADAVVLISAE